MNPFEYSNNMVNVNKFCLDVDGDLWYYENIT